MIANRNNLITELQQQFPDVVQRGSQVSPMLGGRTVAEQLLAQVNPIRYASSRNFLDGAVTRLSPYIRHGVLSLAEVRDTALRKVSEPTQAGKFINELGWRDYWQRIYDRIGEGIWKDREAIKTGHALSSYANILPEEIRSGNTGMACIDGFIQELYDTGYLHNHARMWLASYLIHWRKVRWQVGAKWFLEHLLDGDPASNNLSWQWVASTFSHKPYFFNRENLDRFTNGQFCQDCPLQGHCDLEDSYESLERQLFRKSDSSGSVDPALKKYPAPAEDKILSQPVHKPIVWIHNDCLNPQGPAIQAFPAAPAIFIWDEAWLLREVPSFKRLLFIRECLQDLPVVIQRGSVMEEVLRFVREHQADGVCTTRSVCPFWKQLIEQLQTETRVQIVDVEPLIDHAGPFDLGRFSRYWSQAESHAYSLRS